MKIGFKRGEKGFTLVELMVVMGIMAILASIVVPAISGTKQLSQDTQVQQDASAVETAVGNYNADANAAERFTTDNTSVMGESTNMTVSSRWPEDSIATAYSGEFPESVGTESNEISSVTIKGLDGTVLYQTGGTTGYKLADFVEDYNAIDMMDLAGGGYLTEEPKGYSSIFSASEPYHNYLWMLEKVASGEGTDTGRVVAIFSLTEISGSSTIDLTYKKVY